VAFLSSSNVSALTGGIKSYELPNHPGTSVFVREIPMSPLRRLAAGVQIEGTDGDGARQELIQRCIVNEDGSQMFSEDFDVMESITPKLFKDFMTVIGKAHNGSAEVVEEKVSELEKN